MRISYLQRSTAACALAASMLAPLVLAAPAHAGGEAEPQAAPTAQGADAARADDGDRLGDIVVTALRRDSNLQSTPVAVSAVDAALIQQTSPRDIGDLAAFVPNFSANTITNFNAASFAMRGVGQTSIIVYFEPPVAVLVDDFVVSSVQTQLLDTFDVAQVEVLRGPQGTLFGKNTTGGAVTVRTKRPELGEFGFDARAEAGSFGTGKLQGALNVPFGEALALRVVGGFETSEGYYRNGACYGPVTGFVPNKFNGVSGCLDGRRAGGKEVANLRAKLLFEPTDRIRVLAQYEWLRDRSETVPSVNENDQFTGTAPFLTDLLNTVRPNPRSSDPLDNAAVTYRQDGLIKMRDGQRISVDGLYFNADIDFDFGTLTSVTGWRKQESRIPNSYAGAAPIAADGQPLSFFEATRHDDRNTFQQELRFATNLEGPFDMVAGAFYQRETIDFCVAQILGFLDLTSGPLPFGNWNDTPYILCNAQKSRSKAVFAEGTFEFTPTLSLTVGGRYTWEDKEWFGRQQVFIPALGGGFDTSIQIDDALDASVFDYPAGVVTVEDEARRATWRASLGWQATPDIFGYATYSRGFKSGGFNDQIGGFAAFGNDLDAFREAARATKPETADSFELGVKTELFDRRLRFNLTGFYVKYKDLQKQLNVPLEVNGQPNQVTIFVNAASATVKGIEAEATARVFQGFTLRGVLGFQDSAYDSYTAPTAGYDLSTAPLDRAPRWQWTVDGTYEVPLGAAHKVVANASAAYTSRNLNTQAIDDPLGNTFLNARTLVNASITLAEADDQYYLRLLGRNLTDERYRIASQNVAGLWLNSNFGAPRYYGIEREMKTDFDLWEIHIDGRHPFNARAPWIDNGTARPTPERYTDRAFAKAEWDKVFARSWLLAGPASDIPEPGDFMRFDIGPESFLVVRGENGSIHAHYNVCPHRGSQLVTSDFGSVDQFTCPFHSWKFALDGRNIAVTDAGTFRPEVLCHGTDLSTVRCEVAAGLVFVSMQNDIQPLREFLGPILPQLELYEMDQMYVVQHRRSDWGANWKGGVDAFAEIYHLHAVHPQTQGLMDDRTQIDLWPGGLSRQFVPFAQPSPRYPDQQSVNPGIQMMLKDAGIDPATYTGTASETRAAVQQAKRRRSDKLGLRYERFSDSQLSDSVVYSIFPNVQIGCHPEAVFLHRFIPHFSDPDQFTYDTCILYRHVDAPGYSAPAWMGLGADVDLSGRTRPEIVHTKLGEPPCLGEVLDQDSDLLPVVQKGAHSRGFRGPLWSEQEGRLRHFHAELDRKMAE